MLLTELFKPQPPLFAYFEPCDNADGIHGVHLVFIKPLKTWYERNIQDAADRNDPQRAARLRSALEQHLAHGRVYDTPELGWWPSEDNFYSGNGSEFGGTKEKLISQYPTLRIKSSKDEALQAVRDAGLI